MLNGVRVYVFFVDVFGLGEETADGWMSTCALLLDTVVVLVLDLAAPVPMEALTLLCCAVPRCDAPLCRRSRSTVTPPSPSRRTSSRGQ